MINPDGVLNFVWEQRDGSLRAYEQHPNSSSGLRRQQSTLRTHAGIDE